MTLNHSNKPRIEAVYLKLFVRVNFNSRTLAQILSKMNREARFATVSATASSIFSAIPIGTIIILVISCVFLTIGLLAGFASTSYLAIQSDGVIHGLPWRSMSYLTSYILLYVSTCSQFVLSSNCCYAFVSLRGKQF